MVAGLLGAELPPHQHPARHPRHAEPEADQRRVQQLRLLVAVAAVLGPAAAVLSGSTLCCNSHVVQEPGHGEVSGLVPAVEVHILVGEPGDVVAVEQVEAGLVRAELQLAGEVGEGEVAAELGLVHPEPVTCHQSLS